MVSILLGEQRYFEETLPISELKELLDAGSMSTAKGQAERIRGLKWLMAMISKGTDVSRFFPDVIRNIMTPNLELKKLVYMYVLHYADHDEASRSAALLSINAFQRDLSDEHEFIRGLALRTLTSIRVEDIQGVQALAVRTCARDSSPYVRKIATNAVIKICLSMSKVNEVREQLEEEVLGKLLLDPSPSVMGSAAEAMLQLCPERYALVNTAFDRVVNVLPEVDEWGQISILGLLSRFARYSFTNPVLASVASNDDEDVGEGVSVSAMGGPSKRGQRTLQSPDEDDPDEETYNPAFKKKWQGVVLAPVAVPTTNNKRRLPTKTELDSFLDDTSSPVPIAEEVPKIPASSPVRNISEGKSVVIAESLSHGRVLPMHEKHRRLLKAALPLLKSRNSGVVIAAASTMWYCGQRSKNAMSRVAQALVRLIKSPYREVRYCALRSVLPLIRERPGPFAANLPDFFVNPSVDAPFVRNLKLEIMCYLVRESTLPNVLRELETYVTHPNENFAAQAVRIVGSIALQNSRAVARDCLLGLSGFISADGSSKRVLEESIVVARDVLAALRRPALETDELGILWSLLRGFDKVAPTLVRARYSLVWLAREFFEQARDEAGDILRSVASSFGDEAVEVKLQTLSLACVLQEDEVVLSTYVLELGEFDNHSGVRDWARFLSEGEHCPGPETTPIQSSSPASRSTILQGDDPSSAFEIDSLSFMVGKHVPGYVPLPEWATEVRIKYPSTNRTESESSSSSISSSSDEEESSSSEAGSSSDEEEPQEIKAEPSLMNNAARAPVVSPLTQIGERPTPVTVQLPADSAQALPLAPPSQATMPERQVEFKPLLSHVRGQGLQIDHWFSREPVEDLMWTLVRLRIANKLDDRPVTRIKIESNDLVKPLFDTVESLGPAFCRDDLKILVAFKGHWRAPVKFVVTADEIGKLHLDIRAPAGELLFPDSQLTVADFGKWKKQLVGMNETIAKVANPHAYNVVNRVLSVCNFHAFPSEGGSALLSDTLSFKFAGKRSDGAFSRVLLEVNVGLDGMLDMHLQCENAMAGQSLMNEIKTAFEG